MTELDRYRLLVVVGTGGVGKTTISAALALEAAQRGRRALVLTIDPARALARALGLAELGPDAQLPFAAAMLDPKRAWDAFVQRHAPSVEISRTLLANPFYQRLSTSFAGSTEYMAIEEMCRYAESGDYDLIVLDTPPAAHALDFVHAPERIDRLLDPSVYRSLALGAWKSAGAAARFLLRRLERATGASTLRDIVAFFAALDALVDGALARTRRARALLRGGDAAFVLVTAPRQLVIEQTADLRAKLAAQPTPLAAVVINRVHAVPDVDASSVERLGDDPAARWLQRAWADAVTDAHDDSAVVDAFRASLPTTTPLVTIAEAEHDLHSLDDLAIVAEALRQMPRSATTMPVTAINPPAAVSP